MLTRLMFLGVAALLIFATACDDDDDDAVKAAPLAITDRLLTPEDVEGYSTSDRYEWDSPDDEGLDGLTVVASPEEIAQALEDAGFKAGAAHTFSREDPTEPADFIAVVVLQLGSDDGARDVLEFSADDSQQPCPETCAFSVASADVEGIPGARGVLRLATEESLAAIGETEMGPGEIHRIAFTDGPFFYQIVTVHTPPSDDAAEEAQSLAKQLYDRVKGAPAPAE